MKELPDPEEIHILSLSSEFLMALVRKVLKPACRLVLFFPLCQDKSKGEILRSPVAGGPIRAARWSSVGGLMMQTGKSRALLVVDQTQAPVNIGVERNSGGAKANNF